MLDFKIKLLYFVAMNKPAHPVHLEIQTHRGHPVGLLRSSYRDAQGKVKHDSLGRITGRSLQELRLLQAALQGKAVPLDSPQSLKILAAKEYGASAALLQLATQ